jgi:hypothetical protein
VIPPFLSSGLLPKGIHQADWSEIERVFGSNAHRLRLLKGLLAGLKALHVAGCTLAYIDGSFVTAKSEPGDFDICYESSTMDFSLLDSVLKDFSNHRTAQKQKFGGEFFESEAEAIPDGTLYIDFFQMTKDGKHKGIISIELEHLPQEVSHD